MKASFALLLASGCIWGCQSKQASTEVAADTDSTDNTEFAEKFAETLAESFAGMLDIDVPTPGEIEDPKAKQIVDAMYAAYADLDTYSDKGALDTGAMKIEFVTRYKKPYGLVFECTIDYGAGQSRNAYWTKGVRGTSNWELFGMTGTEEDVILTDLYQGAMAMHNEDLPLEHAIATLMGAAMHTGVNVPVIIFPNETKVPFINQFADLAIEGTETVRGFECDVLYSEGWTERFWIDQKTHLLIQVENGLFGSTEPFTTEYWPVVNEEIDDGDMVFDVPR